MEASEKLHDMGVTKERRGGSKICKPLISDTFTCISNKTFSTQVDLPQARAEKGLFEGPPDMEPADPYLHLGSFFSLN